MAEHMALEVTPLEYLNGGTSMSDRSAKLLKLIGE